MRIYTNVVLLAVAIAVPAFAQDASQPFARAHLEPAAVVTVGQPITVVVEVLVPSFFSGAPRFAHLDVPDALVIFNDRGSNISERIDGQTWAGQSRSYTIYPQRAGAYDIPRIDVQVPYSAPGAGRTTVTVAPEPLRFEATVPAAAEGLGYFIATTSLTVEEATDREELTLRVGESLTRTITVTVDGALSMVIPPLDLGAPDGLAAYSAQPVVDDTGGERGERIVGTRVQSTTFVAEREGSYRLPPVELVWWDVEAEQLRRARAAAIEFEVVANPDLVNEFGLPIEDQETRVETEPGARISLAMYARRYGLPLLVVLAMALVVDRVARRLGFHLGRLFRADPEAREEARLFRTFRDAARSNRPADTARAFMRWLDRWNRRPGTYAEFSATAGDDEMDRQARAVGASLYGRATNDAAAWSGSGLGRRVARVRREAHKRETSAAAKPTLPPLNP